MARGDAKRRVQLVAAGMLAAGLTTAVAIYLTAAEPQSNPLVDQLENSKIYRRSLELYGGKANLLAEDFSNWFSSLWHGKSLGITVAVLTIVGAAIYYFLALPIPPEGSDQSDKSDKS
jgi:hypothetical protein